MYAPATQSQTGTGQSSLISLDDFQTPFNVSIISTISGTVTYNVEYSLDDPVFVTQANATWTPVTNFSAVTGAVTGSLTSPAKALRINITAGTGTVSIKVIQAGPA